LKQEERNLKKDEWRLARLSKKKEKTPKSPGFPLFSR